MKFLVILLSFLFVPFCYSQHEDQIAETESTVPELNAFHTVVYPMWHTAYPNKDYELFKKLLPDLNSGAEKIYSAKLPGILRDKEAEWKEGLAKLRSSVESFNKACNDNNEPGMLKSAEALHSDYEMLVRLVRPVAKEVDEFHKILYMIYHHYGPDNNKAELDIAIDSLVVRAGELKNSVLPKRAESRKADFLKLSEQLQASVIDLQKLKNSDKAVIDKQIDKVHSDYQKLEALFD